MGRYHHIEQAAYMRGIRETGQALGALLRAGGGVSIDINGWSRNDILVRAKDGHIWSAHEDVALVALQEAIRHK